MSASWLAHEPDDETMRSGLLEYPFGGSWTCRATAAQSFSPPMRQRPRNVFYAFSHIDVHTSSNVRLALDVTWDEARIEGVFSTWESESAFTLLGACYVALL
jgi:hypothetical protein